MKAVLLIFGLCPLVLGAQNLIRNGDAESNLANWPATVELCAANPHSDTNCFRLLSGYVESDDLIPVVPTNNYRLSGWFKSADDKTADLFLSLMPLDADKKRIWPDDVGVIPKTETELVETCKADDKVIVVKDGRKWVADDKSYKIYSIAFDVDVSGAYLDLPNRNRSARGGIDRLENFDDKYWEITLAQPCGIRRPAGTKVREHGGGASLMYPVHDPKFKSANWVKLSGDIKGMSLNGEYGNQFWRGTKYVQVVILSLNGSPVFVDDLVLEESGTAETIKAK